MITFLAAFLRRLLWDASAFERYVRTGVAALGQLIQQGVVPIPQKYQWVGALVTAAALLIPAGEKNAPAQGETAPAGR